MDKPIDTVLFSIVGLNAGGEVLKNFTVGVPGDLLGHEPSHEFQLLYQHFRSDDQISLLEGIFWQAASLIAQGDMDKRAELIKEFKERF